MGHARLQADYCGFSRSRDELGKIRRSICSSPVPLVLLVGLLDTLDSSGRLAGQTFSLLSIEKLSLTMLTTSNDVAGVLAISSIFIIEDSLGVHIRYMTGSNDCTSIHKARGKRMSPVHGVRNDSALHMQAEKASLSSFVRIHVPSSNFKHSIKQFVASSNTWLMACARNLIKVDL